MIKQKEVKEKMAGARISLFPVLWCSSLKLKATV
jgi:hypothetical protein